MKDGFTQQSGSVIMEPVVVEEVSKPVDKKDSRRKLVTVLVLTFVNLTYYADKYGIAGKKEGLRKGILLLKANIDL